MDNLTTQDENKIAPSRRMILVFFVILFVFRFFEKKGWINFPDSVVLCMGVILLIEFWVQTLPIERPIQRRISLLTIFGAGLALSIIIRTLLSGTLSSGIVYGCITFIFLLLVFRGHPKNWSVTPIKMRDQLTISLTAAILIGLFIQVFD
jgi:protein-S-isoprenylcysteine O-methyltransferase Ste14